MEGVAHAASSLFLGLLEQRLAAPRVQQMPAVLEHLNDFFVEPSYQILDAATIFSINTLPVESIGNHLIRFFASILRESVLIIIHII